MVETTIILGICLLMLLGMLEMSLALIRHTAMCESARRVARAAIVRGSEAPAMQGTWGPAELSLSAANDHPAAAVARTALATLNPSDVQIRLTWLDSGNRPDQRVRVAVRCTHHPIVPIPGWYTELDLRGESTMRVAH